uniref:DUF834 domain-containing protein n=1 Tax=Oryza rufipogon TaxID=4529 RepID=A0A0E0Q6P4_ORYRU
MAQGTKIPSIPSPPIVVVTAALAEMDVAPWWRQHQGGGFSRGAMHTHASPARWRAEAASAWWRLECWRRRAEVEGGGGASAVETEVERRARTRDGASDGGDWGMQRCEGEGVAETPSARVGVGLVGWS